MASPSSVLFSLQELSRMEEERVRSVAEATERDAARREEADRGAQARARAEEAQARRATEDAQREAERRVREGAARVEGIHRAAVDAARLEVELRARAEERERERRHALDVENARALARRPRATAPAWAALGAVVAAGLAVGMHFGVTVPRADAVLRAAQDTVAARDVAVAELRAGLDASEARVASLEAGLASSRDANAALQARLDARPATLARDPHDSHAPHVPTAPRADPRLDGLTSCAPGSRDPLCVH